jgi:hypothetical protein
MPLSTDKRIIELILYSNLAFDCRQDPSLRRLLEDLAQQANNQAGIYYQQLLDRPSKEEWENLVGPVDDTMRSIEERSIESSEQVARLERFFEASNE